MKNAQQDLHLGCFRHPAPRFQPFKTVYVSSSRYVL